MVTEIDSSENEEQQNIEVDVKSDVKDNKNFVILTERTGLVKSSIWKYDLCRLAEV